MPLNEATGALMAGDKINFSAAASAAKTKAVSGYERSEISFPYMDLDDAVDVSKKLYSRSGISSCPLDELAAAMGQTTSSGNFRLKTATARTFGLAERDGQGSIKLTDLGCRLVSPESEADAKASAFLQVPLYAQIYEKYKGKLLPPTKALEREMQTMGVSSKQTDKARHAFQRSARQAGFFNSGDDRLVRPRSTSGESAETLDQASADSLSHDAPVRQPRRGFGGNGGSYHPFIEGLLQTLPEPGTLWAMEGRAAWLRAAANNFTLMYQGEGQIVVEAKDTEKVTATAKKGAAA